MKSEWNSSIVESASAAVEEWSPAAKPCRRHIKMTPTSIAPVGLGNIIILAISGSKIPNSLFLIVAHLVGHNLHVVGGSGEAERHGIPVAHLNLLYVLIQAAILA